MGTGWGVLKVALHIPLQLVILSMMNRPRMIACNLCIHKADARCPKYNINVLADETVRRGADEVDGAHASADDGGDGDARLVEDVDVLADALKVLLRAERERRHGAGAVHANSDQPEEVGEVLHVCCFRDCGSCACVRGEYRVVA